MENKLTGKFKYILFKTDSYMVSSFLTIDDEYITVTGPYYNYKNNQIYDIYGDFKEHPKYGFQFNYYKLEEVLPDSKDLIINFLSSSTFKGVGTKMALKIYDYFGDDALNILKNNPEEIYNTSLGNKIKDSIYNGFISFNDPKNEIVYELILGGFSNNESLMIYDRFKLNTTEIINSNPYRFYLDVYGISFNKVCKYCENKEFENKLIKYKEAYLIYLFKEIAFQRGDIYLYLDDFIDKYNQLFEDNDIEEVIDKAIKDNYLIKEDNRFYLFNEYNDECYIASYLKNFTTNIFLEEEKLNEAINNLSYNLDIKYDDTQLKAIRAFFNENFSIITGGPGSGKTTVVKSLVSIFKEYFPFKNVVVVAPTGRAAKRISEICDVESKTIHSLLKWNKETNQFVFNKENPILYDAIIIDEFSMVDNFLFSSLLKACEFVSKICIIGDDNQLPSIRQGNILEDLISSKLFSITKLNYNHRQKSGSEIIELANDIISNNCDLMSFNKDVKFIENISFKDFINMIDEDINSSFSLDDIMVLAPMYKGNDGINNLNNLLQNHFNPKDISKKEKEYSNVIFREGDKILQLKNRPLDDVYNGDIGELKEINIKEKYLRVNYQGVDVFYKGEDINDISLAYALSVHKAQGSEYKSVYLILPKYANNMINKKLLYTAVTRSKYKLVIIGSKDIFNTGISKNINKRKTTLINRLICDKI